MRNVWAVSGLALLMIAGACSKGGAQQTTPPAASERATSERAASERPNDAEQAFHRAWADIAEAGKDVAEAGDIAFQRTKQGAIRAYHKTEQVAGRAGQKLEDAAVLTAVKSRLAADHDTDALDINVDLDQNVVTLRGTVGSPHEAAEAVRIALDTKGVDAVISQLQWR